MKLIAALFLILCEAAFAATPTANITCNRTSGVAPLAVICESGGADGDETRPFHTLLSVWNFGDTGVGNWPYGANTNQSKNGATGPVAAHVYETAGTYTITVLVCDATTCVRDTQTITATEITAGNTVCVGIAATPTQGAGGCPASANTAQKSDGDFDAMMSTQLGASSACGAGGCKRILLQCGESTWAYSANTSISAAGPGLVGKFGTCAAPIITGSVDAAVLTFANSDWRISDLSLLNTGTPSGGTAGVAYSGTRTKMTILRVASNGFNYGFSITGDETAIVESTVTSAQSGSAYGIFSNVATQYGAYMGNYVNAGVSPLVHAFRTQGQVKSVISNNTLHAGNFTALAFHSFDFTIGSVYSEKVVVSDNKFVGAATGLASSAASINPQNTASDERIRDVIFERNWCVAGAVQHQCLSVEAVDVTVRNNLFVITGGTAKRGISVSGGNISAGFPMSTRVNAYNNTGYDADGSTDFVVIRYFTSLSAACSSTAQNNLGYAPGSSNGVTVQNGGSCVVTSTTNSDNTQTRSTSPSFDNTADAPKGFRISTASYAATGGTAVFPASNDDFFNCDDVTANVHIGAMVPRARATCRGVK